MTRAGLWELSCWLLRRRARFQVSGASMSPALASGDQVFVQRRRAPTPGDIVVVRHPYRRDLHLIKRVTTVDTRGACTLHGDNPGESSDSRVFGAVPGELILGTVTSRLPC